MLSEAKIPYIYNFSPSVVPKPNDWKDFICVAGYFFLETPARELDAGLVLFIEKAREDGKKIVYVGFGSIVVPDPIAMTKAVIAAGAGQSLSSLFIPYLPQLPSVPPSLATSVLASRTVY